MTENFTAKTQRTQRFKGVFLCVLRVFAVKTLFPIMFDESVKSPNFKNRY